ncbi:GlxA family transcriptional regulator [Pseudomonas sp. ABC1]|uniref:GlxA family transcriptional regulator n=1 Tax=Pseudomonas sp. ABC1 TaxID=2748080 RepID=UPI0015C35E60|nr:GlxA family transcriptional regulator [Pseudomonas sp. ABC1]QLF91711.1 GlxA family transcriptional regulator [Pseudomonas sp. ABC1]
MEPTQEIALLLYPDAQLAAVHGLTDLFKVANRMAEGHAGVRVSHWTVAGDEAPRRVFDSHPGAAGEPGVILLPPCLERTPSGVARGALGDWLRQRHGAGVTIASVCAGAFLLAEAGLLDGRSATTHWSLAQALAERFPKVRVEAERMLVDDGDIITAGGLMAWSDLGLALVARFLGPAIASQTAHFLVIDLSRESQLHFSAFTPRLDHGDGAILRVQHWLRGQLSKDVGLLAMAEQAGLGERTFLRRFSAATGFRPTEYCQQLRVAKARELLELTRDSIEQVAWSVGYQDPGAFRKIFARLVGLQPGEYRRRFSLGRTP